MKKLLVGLAVIPLLLSVALAAETVYSKVTTLIVTTVQLANGETIVNSTDGEVKLTRNTSGTLTVTCADDDATCALTIAPGGAAALGLGGASTTAITLQTDSTGNGELVVPNESIGAAEILNLVRSVPLQLPGWVPCADLVWDSSGADTEPDFELVNSGLSIEYDATGGSVDTGEICASFTVPADYASGGAFIARVVADAATVTQVETFSCRLSVDGATVGAANAGNLANQTAVQNVTSTPAGTWVAGASILAACKQGNASADDTINILSIEGQYTATQ